MGMFVVSHEKTKRPFGRVLMERGSQAPKTHPNGRVSGVLMGAGVLGQRKVQPPKTSGCARFRGSAGKRKAQPPKTSSRAHFREVWVVVLARGGSNPRKRAVALVFGVVVVVVREGLTSPKTSAMARFQGVVSGSGRLECN